MRIDDLDTPRNIKGADSIILNTLEAFGLYWDEQVAYQSQHQTNYADALANLQQLDLIYPCTCSRKTLTSLSQAQHGGEIVYPGYCRNRNIPVSALSAWRIKVPENTLSFTDALQGEITENLATQHGDFILLRKDQIIAYQLAVVTDDYLQNITHVVRGADLLSSTIKQCYLHQCLHLPIPQYAHVPLICNPDGSKLSKKFFAQAVTTHNKQQLLFRLLQLLQQNPPLDLAQAPILEQIAWAIAHWQSQALYKQPNLNASY